MVCKGYRGGFRPCEMDVEESEYSHYNLTDHQMKKIKNLETMHECDWEKFNSIQKEILCYYGNMLRIKNSLST